MQQRITLSQLETFLMKAADILRGSMDASEYKEFLGHVRRSKFRNQQRLIPSTPTKENRLGRN